MMTFIFILLSFVFSYGITESGINENAQLMIIIPFCIINGAILALLENASKNNKRID